MRIGCTAWGCKASLFKSFKPFQPSKSLTEEDRKSANHAKDAKGNRVSLPFRERVREGANGSTYATALREKNFGTRLARRKLAVAHFSNSHSNRYYSDPACAECIFRGEVYLHSRRNWHPARDSGPH